MRNLLIFRRIAKGATLEQWERRGVLIFFLQDFAVGDRLEGKKEKSRDALCIPTRNLLCYMSERVAFTCVFICP